MNEVCAFEQIQDGDVESVGGKGSSLGRMVNAGLPVPPGFCVTTHAYRRLRGQSLHEDASLVAIICDAYRQLGGGRVAVRSSANAEDGSATSFAGQQETILGVQGERDVCDAIARCWQSLHTERALAYRLRQGIADDGLAMAVVVQRLVAAESAGVLFTRDPLDSEGKRMLVEAAWGLGESVVSGKVEPDRYHLDRESGSVLSQHVGNKTQWMTANGWETVPVDKQVQPCLEMEQLRQLADWGRRIEALYGEARDIEWAWAEGRFWLLQARPITAADAAERERVRREEIGTLAKLASPHGTVWSRYNVPEGMPEPTPMSWALVRFLWSDSGGCGLMYRDLGYARSHLDADQCIYDLVAGRVYCNLSREVRQHPSWLPLEYPFAALKADPRSALAPRPVRDPSRAGALLWLFLPLRLPFLIAGSMRRMVRLGSLSNSFADHFRRETLPGFAEETERAAAEDWSVLETKSLLERWYYWCWRTLGEFARDSLKPTILAAVARTGLESLLRRKLGRDRALAALGELSMGIRPDAEADLPAALRDVAEGRLERGAFLQRFGHRGHHDMELAQPRWSEDSAALDRLLRQPAALTQPRKETDHDWRRIADEAHFSKLERAALEPQVRALQTYLSLRETAKHYFMRGYALMRRALVELDKRHRLQGGIFFLTPEEVPRLTEGQDLWKEIAERKRRHTIALSLQVPPVIFSDDLDAIGRPRVIEGGKELRGVPLSAGIAEAPAFVLHEPRMDNLPDEPYVLVCPSTDPAWVPLFARACGLVMEIGGVLSHGAIVAREFGLPAVAGLPNVQHQLRTGQRLHVDGGSGVVVVLKD